MIILNEKLNFDQLSVQASVMCCLLFASIYVLSLYLWSSKNRFNRSEPRVIKRRFVSVLITCFVCFILVYSLGDTPSKSDQRGNFTICEWIGIKFNVSMITSSVAALFLTSVLFAGPIVQHLVGIQFFSFRFEDYEYETNSSTNINYHLQKNQPQTTVCQFMSRLRVKLWLLSNDLIFWRNYVVSPFTEEFVFRSCMLPLLVNHFGLNRSCLLAPCFFAVAHLHHIIEGACMGEQLTHLLLQHMFQFTYTYVFGLYSCYLFLRTGHLMPSFVSHSFCNFMSVPNLHQLINAFDFKFRIIISIVYFVGLASFFFLLSTVTDPTLYDNQVYYLIK